ncbi:MAG: putative ABC transporter permease [Clostridia bacterium]|nr:putative ABC transporter permease [Clostridia bacterium]
MENFMKIIYILDFFLVYSFAGWVLESVYKTICTKKFVNSGFLYGVFCPIYGIGALIMYLFLSICNNPITVFLTGFVVLSVWEYIVSWGIEKIFHETYWDYSNYKFNINGRVCLLNSIFWGVLGVIFTYIVHPLVEIQIIKINDILLIVITVTLLIIMLIDAIISIIKLNDISKKLETIKEIRKEIKVKLQELKATKNAKESIQLMINDLKEKEIKLKEKLVKQTDRIRKAFPTMKSETFKQIAKYRRK